MQNKCLGVFLVFITIPLVILSIFLLGSTKLTSPKYYKDLFKKSNSYTLAIKALPKGDSANPETGDILTAISTNATSEWLEKNISTNLDQFDAFLNNRSAKLDPSIDISIFKDELASNLPTEFQEMIPNTFSFTTYNEYLKNATDLFSSASKSTPGTSEVDMNSLKKQLQSAKNAQEKFNQNSKSIKTGYRRGKIITFVIYALTILLLAVIATAARHYIPAIFRWTGQTLFIGGLFSLITAFLIQYFAKNYDLIASFKLTIETHQLIVPIYRNLTNDITTKIIWISFLIAGIGLISVIVSYILVPFSPLPPKPNPVKP